MGYRTVFSTLLKRISSLAELDETNSHVRGLACCGVYRGQQLTGATLRSSLLR